KGQDERPDGEKAVFRAMTAVNAGCDCEPKTDNTNEAIPAHPSLVGSTGEKFCHPLSPKGMSHKMSRKCRTHSEEASVHSPRRSCCGSAHGLYAACRRSGRQLPCRQQPFPLVAEQLCMGDGPGGVGAPAAVLLLRPDAAVAAPLPAGELRTP